MPERPVIGQGVQIGVETIEGTGVPANKRLTTIGWELQPKAEFSPFRPMGAKYPSTSPIGKEWGAAALSGRGSYTDLVYALSSVLTTAAITTPSGTLPRLWTFNPANLAADTPKTFSVEQGDPNFAEKMYGLKVVDLSMSFNRDVIEVSGSAIGNLLQTGATLTATPTTVAQKIMLANQVQVFMDASFGALGTTKLPRPLSVNWGVSGRFGPLWVLDSSLASYAATIETEPDTDFTLVMQADASGHSLIPFMRADTMRYFRVRATTPDFIEAAVPWQFTLDVACKIQGEPQYTEVDGVKGITWPMKIHDDGVWGQPFKVMVQNQLAAL